MSLNELMPFDSLVYAWKKAASKAIDLGRAYSLNIFSVHKLLSQAKLPETKIVDALDPIIEAPCDSLAFESRFECGNLAFASKVGEGEYNLLMSSDVNSRGHTQWFFFRVSRTVAGHTVKFNLVNFEKPDSLYNKGMKVLTYSSRSYELHGAGWRRGGEGIAYYKNGISRHVTTKSYYTLTFTYTFDHSEDTVYFAYCYPYTYSELQEYLDTLEARQETYNFVTRKMLCRTIAGNRCDYLTITNPGEVEDIQMRKGVVLSARVHPGETVGSWMMQGVLEFLVSNTPEADLLRSLYVFKIVPMLNPDGTIRGNHRCSFAGCDLNRVWKRPRELSHPVISSFKRLIKLFASNYRLEMICDMHGHSRKSNVFMYGCNIPSDPAACKVFPYIVSKVSSVFSFEGCRFGVQKDKESTLRISLFKELKLPTVFTCEASFCGASTGKYAGFHFTTDLLKEMGKDLCLSLLVYTHQRTKIPSELRIPFHKPTRDASQGTGTQLSLTSLSPQLSELAGEDFLVEFTQSATLLHFGEDIDSSDDSDSAPSEDDLPYEEMSAIMPKSEMKAGLKQSKHIEKTLDARKELKVRPVPRKQLVVKSASMQQVVILTKTERTIKVTREATHSPVLTKPSRPQFQSKRRLDQTLTSYYQVNGKRVMDKATQTPPQLYQKHDSKRSTDRKASSPGRTGIYSFEKLQGDHTATKSVASLPVDKNKILDSPYGPRQALNSPLQSFGELIKHSSEKRLPKSIRPIRTRVVPKRPETRMNDEVFHTMAISSLTLKNSMRTTPTPMFNR